MLYFIFPESHSIISFNCFCLGTIWQSTGSEQRLC